MTIRPLLTFIALLALAASSALCEYQKAVYPQAPMLVTGIQVKAPASAALGTSIRADIVVNASAALPGDRRAYVHLVHKGAVRSAQVILPESGWRAGANTLKAVKVSIPANIPTGDYTIVAGVYLEKAQGTAALRVTGRQVARLAKIVTTGAMVDKHGTPHQWHINDAHALIWDGRPWMPAGGMFVYGREWETVKEQIDLLKRYGVDSIYLHLGVNQPYPWKTYSDDDYAFFQKTIDYLDDNGFKYGLEFQALEAKGPGYYYPGRGPRVEITDSGLVKAEEDKTLEGHFVVVNRDNGQVVQTGTARVEDRKKLEADVVVPRPGRYKVHFVLKREAPDSYSMYYWDDKYPNYLDVMRKHYSKVNLGPGFRFLVDPLWNEMNINRDFFPSSPIYYTQFADWLKKRYRSIDGLNRHWRPDTKRFQSFEQAARMAPVDRMRSADERIEFQYVMDPETSTVIRMDLAATQYNYDCQEFLGRSLLHFTSDIADQFKKLNDVPVIYKGFSDMDFWHINDLGTPGGHDGLGMESYGNGEPMLMFMSAHLYGELEQATKTTWLIVTETGEGNHQDNSPSRNKMPGYSSRVGHMYANFNAMVSGGAKGVFHYNMIPGRGSNDPWTDSLMSDVRQLEWLSTYGRILANASALVDWKPPMYFRFPGLYNPNSMNLWSEPNADYANFGGWWWREPVERSENDIWIVPSFSLRPDAPMFIVNLEKMPATERHRAELTKAIADGVRITMIGFRKDLGHIPAVDRYYTGQYATDSDGRKFQVLKPSPTSRVLGRSPDGKVWNLIDGRLQINSKEVFGLHGYRPDNLAAGPERSIEPYYGIFSRMLNVTLLPTDDGLYGLHYADRKQPITIIGTTGGPRTITYKVPAGSRIEARYPNGEPAGEIRGGTLVIRLEPVKMELVKQDQWDKREANKWVRDGVLVDSVDARDSVIIRGVPLKNAVPLEAAGMAITAAKKAAEGLEGKEKARVDAVVARAMAASARGDYAAAARIASKDMDAAFAELTPYVWIEAEDRKDSNFNYSRLGGIPRMSGGAFLGLETAVEPPKDTGWFANYDFTAPADGTYQLWVRENYLSYSSPSSWRIDGGKWVRATNQLVPHDARVVSLYNAVEDTRQVFGWYHYGDAKLKKGRHTIAFRVTEKRGKGTSVTMADDRPYAKLMDCILLTQRGFVPNGPAKPRTMLNYVLPPMVNKVQSPSFEFRPDQGMKAPTGWLRSEESDAVRWQDAGWGTYNVMPGVSMDLGQRFSYVGQRCLAVQVRKDTKAWWRSDLMDVTPGKQYYFEAWARTPGVTDAGVTAEVMWFAENGQRVGIDDAISVRSPLDWQRLTFRRLFAPEAAIKAQVNFEVGVGSGGMVYFDDVVFAELQPWRKLGGK